jgi:hypothetical protein
VAYHQQLSGAAACWAVAAGNLEWSNRAVSRLSSQGGWPRRVAKNMIMVRLDSSETPRGSRLYR